MTLSKEFAKLGKEWAAKSIVLQGLLAELELKEKTIQELKAKIERLERDISY